MIMTKDEQFNWPIVENAGYFFSILKTVKLCYKISFLFSTIIKVHSSFDTDPNLDINDMRIKLGVMIKTCYVQ